MTQPPTTKDTTMSETLDYFKKFWAATEAAGIGYCEHCGAEMTGVELPNGKIRAWIDHTADCPNALDAGVFTLTPPAVLREYTRDEMAMMVAAAKAAVDAQNPHLHDHDRRARALSGAFRRPRRRLVVPQPTAVTPPHRCQGWPKLGYTPQEVCVP
jgi:hypothetical protein